MRTKLKLELIDNYIAIYRILYICKQRIFLANTNIEELNKICNEVIQLKKEYEEVFVDLKMNDDSFLVLKNQLQQALKNNLDKNPTKTTSSSKLLNKINDIKKVKEKILDKIKYKQII